MRARALVTGLGVVLLAGLTVAAGAWAPPALGVPNVSVGRTCVEYGSRLPVHGSGFAPGVRVTLSAPLGHYAGPPLPGREIVDRTLTADRTGSFNARLPMPRRLRGLGPAYQPRSVFGAGAAGVDGRPASSYAGFVLAIPGVCRALARAR